VLSTDPLPVHCSGEIAGKPSAEVLSQLAAFAAAGVRHMQLNFLDFPRTESLDLFVEEVLPYVERAGT
jgi:hypothetical protein